MYPICLNSIWKYVAVNILISLWNAISFTRADGILIAMVYETCLEPLDGNRNFWFYIITLSSSYSQFWILSLKPPCPHSPVHPFRSLLHCIYLERAYKNSKMNWRSFGNVNLFFFFSFFFPLNKGFFFKLSVFFPFLLVCLQSF